MRLRRSILLALSSGVLQALAQPPFGMWPLAFVAVLPLLLAAEPDQAPGSGRRNLLLGLVAGLAFYLPGLFWITHTMTVFGELSWPVSLLLLLGFASIFAIDMAALLWAFGRALRFGAGAGLAVFPLLWAAMELLKSRLWTGYPWLLASHALVPRPELLWPSTILGVSFLSALVVTVSVALLASIRDVGSKSGAIGFAVLVLVVIFFGAGFVRNPWARRAGAPRPATLRVLVIQPGVPQKARWDFQERGKIYRDLLEQTRAAAARTAPELIVWSESSLPFGFDSSLQVQQDVKALAQETGASILLNTIREESEDVYFNSARVIAPGGSVSEAYDKRHLVPFGEYVPARWIFGWAGKIVRGIGDFTAGTRAHPLPVGFTREGQKLEALAGVAVCYEAVFPEIFREASRDGANFFVTITNDGWYGGLGAEEQHWNGAVVSAVASGRSLVRAAVSGISGFVSPDGEVIARIPLGQKGEIAADLPLRADSVPSERCGDVFAWFSAAIASCVILLSRGRIAKSGGAS